MKIRCANTLALSTLLCCACAGDLDDPTAFEAYSAIPAIRLANTYPPQAGTVPQPVAVSPTVAPSVAPSVVGGGGGVADGPGCPRAVEIFASESVCAGSSCHGVPGTPATAWVDLVQDPGTLAARLSTTMGKGACESRLILDTANPAESLLLTKLTDPVPCGALMPFLPTYILSDMDRQCITDWVMAQGSTP